MKRAFAIAYKFVGWNVTSIMLGALTLFIATTLIAIAHWFASLQPGGLKDGVEAVAFAWLAGSFLQFVNFAISKMGHLEW